MTTQQPAGGNPMYAITGLQYYVSGRFAALRGCNPVALNLFRHGAEMPMKGSLAVTHSETQLKNLGHNLPEILFDFKAAYPATDLSPIEQVIEDLHRCEDLRYPDRIPGGAASFGIVRTDQEKPVPQSGTDYILSLEEIDLLFSTLIRTTEIQGPFEMAFIGPGTPDTCPQDNLHRLF